MALRTPKEYKADIQKMRVNAYLDGKKVEGLLQNPVTRSVVEAMAKLYELAADPQHEGVMTARSHLTGQKINRNLHVNRSTADLERRADMALLTSQTLGTCNYRCVGCDDLNALGSVVFEVDRSKGTEYARRFQTFLQKAQEKDLAVSGAVTDAKGDRAKLHQSGAFAAHETVVLPGGRCARVKRITLSLLLCPTAPRASRISSNITLFPRSGSRSRMSSSWGIPSSANGRPA